MENTVVILNEEMCSMSIAFEKVGFDVVVAYINDDKLCDFYDKNIKGSYVVKNLFECDPNLIPDADVIAGKIIAAPMSFSTKSRMDLYKRDGFQLYYNIVRTKSPKFFLFEMSRVLWKSEITKKFTLDLSELGYAFRYLDFDINRYTGLPVSEHRTYLVGVRYDVAKEFYVEDQTHFQLKYVGKIFEYDITDPWYYNVGQETFDMEEYGGTKEQKFFCWQGHEYKLKENITWNYVKVPLVVLNGRVRKLTPREVARLKGYPEDFYLYDKNRSWLYQKLMFASNINVMSIIASSIKKVINGKTFLNQQVMRGKRFEELFERYLEAKYQVQREINAYNYSFDFMIKNNDERIFFELKIYAHKYITGEKLIRVCQKINAAAIASTDKVIIVVANVVEEMFKQHCRKKYGIIIWDLPNLLFLFDENLEIKSEFISLLDYTVNDIKIVCPNPSLIELSSPELQEGDLYKQLKAIKPGKEEFVAYEKVCIDILKNVFGDFLTLWKEQQNSNEGMFRFDLCCKIKHGETHEFFDTIKNFFKSKYILFEFKNYNLPITQSEIYTTEKYLYKTALRCVAIIISRKGASENALTAAKGCLRENGKLILCLSDEDLNNLLRIKREDEKPTAEFLADMLDDMLINLGK